jgi:hypothetical protein
VRLYMKAFVALLGAASLISLLAIHSNVGLAYSGLLPYEGQPQILWLVCQVCDRVNFGIQGQKGQIWITFSLI